MKREMSRKISVVIKHVHCGIYATMKGSIMTCDVILVFYEQESRMYDEAYLPGLLRVDISKDDN